MDYVELTWNLVQKLASHFGPSGPTWFVVLKWLSMRSSWSGNNIMFKRKQDCYKIWTISKVSCAWPYGSTHINFTHKSVVSWSTVAVKSMQHCWGLGIQAFTSNYLCTVRTLTYAVFKWQLSYIRNSINAHTINRTLKLTETLSAVVNCSFLHDQSTFCNVKKSIEAYTECKQRRWICIYEGHEPELLEGEKPLIQIHHDESTF